MTIAAVTEPLPRRRVAFRAYERANLFYHKLGQDPADNKESEAGNPPRENGANEHRLPSSQSLENDTLNLNISASGIAFTCRDPLQPGDQLMLRILLLSSMTAITTCCQVVYCKPSNPYETDRHPYSIGAKFINISPTESALLEKHVLKKHRQEWAIHGLLAALVIAVLAAPGTALHFAAILLHRLLNIGMHVLLLGFEFLESSLDHAIEYLLHTEPRTTEVIVYYVIFGMGLFAAYLLWRKIPPALRGLRDRLMRYWNRKKSSGLYFWNQQSPAGKFKMVGLGTAAVVGYIFLSI